MTDTGKKLGWLQALRGVAAVGVVICHSLINLPKGSPYPALIDIFLYFGAGVDLFFVISGFIMVHTTQGDPGGGSDLPRALPRGAFSVSGPPTWC